MSDTSEPTQTPAQLREYAQRQEARAAEAEARAEQAEALQRENAMLRAGVDLDSPLGQVFSRGYDGDIEVDAIREAYGQIAPAAAEPAPAEPPPSEEPSAEELAQAQARSALVAGGAPPGEEPQAPAGQAVMQAYNDARAAGRSVESAQRAGVQTLIDRAVAGDPSALYQQPGETPRAARERWKRERFGE